MALGFPLDDRGETSGVLVKVKDRRAQLAQDGLPLRISQSGHFELSQKI